MTSENPTNKKPAEEQASRSPCAAGCGFYGNPATKNLCSVCFKKMYPNEVEKNNDNNKNKSNDNNNNNGNDNNNDSNKIKEIDTEKKEPEKPKKKYKKRRIDVGNVIKK